MRNEIRVEEEITAFLLDAISAFVWTARADTLELISVNEGFEKLFGYSRARVLSEKNFWLSLIHPADRQTVIISLKTAALHHSDSQFSCRIRTADQEEVWFENFVRFIPYQDIGQLAGLSVRSTQPGIEETEVRDDLEWQLRQAQKMEAIGQLAGSVSHDFNNALMAIHGFCEILLMKIKDEDAGRREVLSIQKATAQAAGIARQLLAFSRKQAHDPRIINMNHLVHNLEPMIQRLLNETIELQILPEKNLGQVNADPGQMEQLILNLTINARDAMPDGGKFTIESANVDLDFEYAKDHLNVLPGPYVMLVFSDTGIGMDESVRSRIFEPFFTTKPSGTGLGLSTCFGIVKQSGGEIWVYSEPRKGTTFRIYLPRVAGLPVADVAAAMPELTGGDESIVVVDDTEAVRISTSRILGLAGYRVLQASSGAEALALIENYKDELHLLISDMVMPGMSGRELARRIREIRPHIKVLFMSGYSQEAVKNEEGFEPDKFLAKPATMDVLLSKIREILDSH